GRAALAEGVPRLAARDRLVPGDARTLPGGALRRDRRDERPQRRRVPRQGRAGRRRGQRARGRGRARPPRRGDRPMSTRTVTAHDKSFPPALHGSDITALDTPLGELATPLLVLDGPAMAHNLQVMADWSAARGLELMPHGKTTMAPVLWHRQLEAGATGITVATGWQADVALRAGVPTVQIANMSLDPALLRTVAAHLADHPEQEFVLWADSIDAVRLMEAALP